MRPPCLCSSDLVCRCVGESCPCKPEPGRDLWTGKFPVRDETLRHQIVLLHEGVSCNCRAYFNRGVKGHEVFAPLGTVEECLKAYADPINHRDHRGHEEAS